MNWVRDWVYLVIKPFLTQLKNRLLNIKLLEFEGIIQFTNSEGVTNSIDRLVKESDLLSTKFRVLNPRNSYVQSGSSTRGYIVLRYPEEGYSYSMALFNLDFYIYGSNKSFSLMIGGYDYSTPFWYKVTAKRKTAMSNDYKKVQFVRFLKDGGDENVNADYNHFGILIGSNDDVRLPYIAGRVVNGIISYFGANDSMWDKDIELFVAKDADLPKYKVDITRTV